MLTRILSAIRPVSAVPVPAVDPGPELTFRQLYERWDAANSGRLRPKAQAECLRILRLEAASLHDRSATSLTRREIGELLASVSSRPGIQRTLHSSIRRVVRWGIGAGLLDLDPTLGLKSAPPKARERVLSLQELRLIWDAVGTMGDYGAIIRLAMLTGARREEIGQLAPGEVNRADAMLEFGPDRMKNHKPFRLPLAPQALALLPEARQGYPHLFGRVRGAGFQGWGRGKLLLDAALIGMRPWVFHDLRRSFVTHANELGLALPHVVELAVNHQSGSRGGVSGVYNRSLLIAERRALAEKWAAVLLGA